LWQDRRPLFTNLAYGWAFFNTVRKVYYNLAITGLSVAICLFIGGIEALSLIPSEFKGLSQSHGFWGFLSRFNLNTESCTAPQGPSGLNVPPGRQEGCCLSPTSF